jgi:CRP-like cAMP-binding protein
MDHFFKDGAVIMQQGEEGHAMYVIIKGKVKVDFQAEDGKVLLTTSM